MNHSDKYKLCVVIPCYNVSKHIEEVINGLPKEINCVIAVNDCSTDNTISILEHLAASNNSIYIVNHAINQGVNHVFLADLGPTGHFK